MEKGFKIRTTPNPAQPIEIKMSGALGIDEVIALTVIAMRSFLDDAKRQMLINVPEPTEEDDRTARAVLYDKAVLAFSYEMDAFFPEAKDLKAKNDGFEEYIKNQNKKQNPSPDEESNILSVEEEKRLRK